MAIIWLKLTSSFRKIIESITVTAENAAAMVPTSEALPILSASKKRTTPNITSVFKKILIINMLRLYLSKSFITKGI